MQPKPLYKPPHLRQKSIQDNKTQPFVNQKSYFSRAANAQSQYDVFVQNTSQAFFGRSGTDFRELIVHILFKCTLKSILQLRLVSKGFHYLASTIRVNHSCSPLSNKATISFVDTQLHPKIKSSIKTKFDYAKNNTQIEIYFSISTLTKPPSIFFSIPENQLKITLLIDALHALNPLKNILSTYPNRKFINKIEVLDFKAVIFNKAVFDNTKFADFINRLSTSVSKNLFTLPSLKHLIIGDLDAALWIPNSLDNLTTLTFGNLGSKAALSLPYSLPKLTSLTLGKIATNAIVYFTDSLQEFNSLIIRNVSNAALPKLPNSYDQLTNLVIGDIDADATVTLPDSLNNLETLTIGDIWHDAILKFPNSLLKLKTLTIGDIWKRGTFLLPISCNNCTSLIIGAICEKVIFKLPILFDKLTNLTIGDIEIDATVELLNSLNNLQSLTIGNIQSDATVKLPDSLDNLTTLNIGYIGDELYAPILKLPGSLKNLKHFTIGAVYNSTICKQLDEILKPQTK